MYCAFDIETFPGDDGRAEISCIGAVWEGVENDFLLYQKVWSGDPAINEDTIGEFLDFLDSFVLASGTYQIATWNGLGYDFKILAERFPDHHQRIRDLAMSESHIDPMFQFLCTKGFPVGLSAVAKGMGLEGKTEGMDGLKASEMWITATPEEKKKILEYVVQDAKATLDIVKAIEGLGYVRWFTKRGYVKVQALDKLLPVTRCLDIPLPDVSWMMTPMKREEFYEWTMKENMI